MTSGCGHDEFQCDSGECISSTLRCDRKYDCQDGTDEFNCGKFVACNRAYDLGVVKCARSEDIVHFGIHCFKPCIFQAVYIARRHIS